MEFQRRVPIEEIVDPSNVVLVFMNFTPENFEQCFSKMEFTMGMDYLSWAIEKFKIPVIFTSRSKTGSRKERMNDYRDMKVFNRSAHSAPKSGLDERFQEEFKKYLPTRGSKIVRVPREDAFFQSTLIEDIMTVGKSTVMLGGFFTEVDVYITAVEALMHDLFSVVISDASSTFSERVFFQSLDIISQVVEVIDTRDLEKIWGK